MMWKFALRLFKRKTWLIKSSFLNHASPRHPMKIFKLFNKWNKRRNHPKNSSNFFQDSSRNFRCTWAFGNNNKILLSLKVQSCKCDNIAQIRIPWWKTISENFNEILCIVFEIFATKFLLWTFKNAEFWISRLTCFTLFLNLCSYLLSALIG